MKSKFTLLGLALGLALLISSTGTSQAQAPYQGIYKCTVSWKGDYKYYDGIHPDFLGYCLTLRGTNRGYIINRGDFYDVVFWDRKNKEFSVVTDCVWDCATQYSCGRRQDKIEVCFSSCKSLNITDGNLDIERCEIICLGGRARERQLGDRENPFPFFSIPTLRGTSCRQSCYRSAAQDKYCFLPQTPGKKDFAYDVRGLTAGATSCVTARHSYRLDTRLTKEWVASGMFSDPLYGRMLVNSFLSEKNTFLGAITATEWCELRNLTGVEPFMP